MKVALYARVSSDRQAEAETPIEGQLTELRAHAQSKGWEVIKEYIEEGVSARSDRRPIFQEMIADAKTNRYGFEAIIVWKFSRFARNFDDSVTYKTLLRRKCSVDIISIREPVDDSSTGRLLERIIEAIDEFYSANLAEDCLRGMRENARGGFFNGGNVPLGYQRKAVSYGSAVKTTLEVDEQYQPLVVRIFQLCLDGLGAKEIARVLNDEHIPAGKSKRWSAQRILYILRNERYTGTQVWNAADDADQVIRSKNAHPAIIESEVFQRAQVLLNARAPQIIHPRALASEYMLSGLLKCGLCGGSMAGATAKSGRYQYYACTKFIKQGKNACRAKQVRKDKLEAMILTQIEQNILAEDKMIELTDLSYSGVDEQKAELEAELDLIEPEIQKVETALERLYKAIESGHLDFADLGPRIKETKQRLDNLRDQQRQLGWQIENAAAPNYSPVAVAHWAKHLRGVLGEADLSEKKMFFRTFIRKIVVNSSEVTIEYTPPTQTDDVAEPFRCDVLPLEERGGAVSA